MSIRMLGIDHNLAPVDIRAVFSFTKKNAVAAMELLKKEAKKEEWRKQEQKAEKKAERQEKQK